MIKKFFVIDSITKNGEYIDPTPDGNDYIIKKAKKEGFTVIEGNSQTLLLDLDSWEAVCRYEKMYNMLKMNFLVTEIERWKSKSGKGLHVVLSLTKEFDTITRIALQAILGSDPKREMFGLIKYSNNVKEPSILFKPPERSFLSNKLKG